LYAEDLADVDITRGDEFGEGFWDAARFMEDARASTGTKLDGKWEYSQVVIVGGKAVGYLIGIRGGVKDFGVPANARHILRLAIAPACRNLKIGTEGKIFLDTNIDLL
jgi:ribosomal protein S18 acetylase RimI-like enzyme